MMGCCGFNCNGCPAFADNLGSPHDQERTVQAWGSYFGISVPSGMACCRGCRSPDREGWDYPDRLCEIRQCVLDRGVETCGECAEFPCARFQERCCRLEATMAHWKPYLTREEYHRFMAPYDARRNLECMQRHGMVPGGD